VPENHPKGNPPKENHTKEAQSNILSSSQLKKDSSTKDVVDKGKKKEEPQKKILEARKETNTKEVEKTSFSLLLKVKWARLKFWYHSMN
jgi:hypothetical protein